MIGRRVGCIDQVVGTLEGVSVGFFVGCVVGSFVGLCVGEELGLGVVGVLLVGEGVIGAFVGKAEGSLDGAIVGLFVGWSVGASVGDFWGLKFSSPPRLGTILFSMYHAAQAKGAFQLTVFSLLPHA